VRGCIQQEDSPARISFIHNPTNQEESARPRTSLLMSHLLHNDLLSKISPYQLLQALGLSPVSVDGDVVQTVLSQERILHEITGGVALADLDVRAFNDYVRSSRLLVRELRLSKGDHAVIMNGRVSFFFAPLSVFHSPTTDDRLSAPSALGSS
jgi:UDP-glucose:glycoprotein glucosyltransferase